MEGQCVFQSNKEIERLEVQNRLLSSIEKPLFASLFASRENLCVLDIGCNDGKKTLSLFSNGNIKKVTGIEYNPDLALKAERAYGDAVFRFVSLDASRDDFPLSLSRLMRESSIASYDCIYLSFVLMHLLDPGKLLSSLKDFLSPSGVIVITEADDGTSFLSGDRDGLLSTFLAILRDDRYSGNRTLGGRIERVIRASGYDDVTCVCSSIRAGEGEREKKEMIYTTFFSYLEEDVDLLIAESDSPRFREWKKWLCDNLSALRALIMSDSSEISMGMKILTVRRKNET